MRLSWCAVLGVLAAQPSGAWAAEPSIPLGSVCVLAAPSSPQAPQAATVAALVTRTEAALRELYGARITATPPLDIDDIQLALGCAGQDPPCLIALARQLRVDTLVLVRASGTGEVSLERFDGHTGTAHGVVRGAEVDVEALARSLLETTSPAPQRALTLPLVAAGAGAATLIAAAVVGVLARSAEADYAAAAIGTRSDVDAALETLSRAEGRATASTVLWVIGGVLVAGGGAWLTHAAVTEEGS